jgi:hypothetical protein
VNSAGNYSPFSTYEAFGGLLFFLRHICFPKFSVSRLLSNKDNNLEFSLAINVQKAVKDDVNNDFIAKRVIPIIKKVEFR